MVYKRYCSPFEQPKYQEPPPPLPEPCNSTVVPHKKNGILGNIGYDDIIIIGLLLVLLLDDTDDKDLPLIIALGFLLITGWL